ncbi:MAG TPA: GntR family transcriptional regulator [Chitinophagaceae bacterium]|jgi:DNA-binding transcriptional regulator YhcF (GntR family)|nr:GntR family transcriptional regulator [Chitinophagaceae bacterium]
MTPLLNIDTENKVPKYIQVVDAITDAIRRGKLKKGQRIHSINELSDEYLLSRDTVERAYTLLRNQGVIMSVKGKGYYIRNIDIDVPVKVLLLFNKISNYKKQIYNSFIQTLGKNAIVDLKIHHFNIQILRTLVENHLADYNYFVIMPHFYDDFDEAVRIIRSIPPEQLIILDKKIPYYDLKCGVVYQDFENDIVDALEQGLDLLAKYQSMVLVHPSLVPYPPEIVRGFRNFCMQNRIAYSIISEIDEKHEVEKGKAYIVIEETDLANLIKKCHKQQLTVGQDVGIISYNETPLKEILLDGITVLSTDHEKMGEMAARLILDNSREKIKNPFALIRRKSL